MSWDVAHQFFQKIIYFERMSYLPKAGLIQVPDLIYPSNVLGCGTLVFPKKTTKQFYSERMTASQDPSCILVVFTQTFPVFDNVTLFWKKCCTASLDIVQHETSEKVSCQSYLEPSQRNVLKLCKAASAGSVSHRKSCFLITY